MGKANIIQKLDKLIKATADKGKAESQQGESNKSNK